MPQLKTKDGKPLPKPEPTCYKFESPRLGFTFELGQKREIFALHSFLSHIEWNGEDEIIFHYTYGTIRVVGHRLGDLYHGVKQQTIGIIRPSHAGDPCRAEIEVRKIAFEDFKTLDD